MDPYVAVYDPPRPSTIGEVTHIRWQGLLISDMLQSVINAAYVIASRINAAFHMHVTSSTGQGRLEEENSFVSLVAHGIPHEPMPTPLRVPRNDKEDTWSMIFMREAAAAQDSSQAYPATASADTVGEAGVTRAAEPDDVIDGEQGEEEMSMPRAWWRNRTGWWVMQKSAGMWDARIG